MDMNLIAWIAVVAVALIGFVTGRFSFEAAKGSLAKFPVVSQVAIDIVAGVQQLKESGKVGGGNAAFDMAYDQLKRMFPDLDEGYLTMTIEGAYLLLKKRLRQDVIMDGDTSYAAGHRGSIGR